MDTTGSVQELFSRIHQHESSLSQIIVASRLSEMEAETSKIRDLLSRAAKLARVPPDQQAELDLHVSEAKRLTTDLVDAGKSGNIEASKARNADLQRELGLVERMLVHPGT